MREDKTFYIAEKRIFRDKKEKPTFRLPALVIAVYHILQSYAWGDKYEAYPSLSTIRNQVLASKQSIVDALYFLDKVKLIQICKDENCHGGRDKNYYYLRRLSDDDIIPIQQLLPAGHEFLKRRKRYRREKARSRRETLDDENKVPPRNHARSSRGTNKKMKYNDKKEKR
ncbi:MAG: hypothetical protein JW807_12745 [Spirochaetes bacterium]|nr:hypothetical protein [Spirochaetota bacterium]